MKSMLREIALALFITGLYAGVPAEEAKHSLYGAGVFNIGQIFQGQGRMSSHDHQWLQAGGMVLGDSVCKGERVSLYTEVLGFVQYSYWINPLVGDLNGWVTRIPIWGFQMNRVEGAYTFFDPKKYPLTLSFGYFPFKYNPDVKNLGEYLFRSMPYPSYVDNVFDEPFTRLFGIRLSSSLLDGSLRQSVVLSSESRYFPMNDVSLAYVGSWNPVQGIEIGAGGQAYHFISVNEDYTLTKSMSTNNREGSWYYASAADSAAGIKTPYTFPGIKAMLRFSIDPMAYIPKINLPLAGALFGKKDLRIYGEADVLGLKNIPTYFAGSETEPKLYEYYNKMSERIPLSFGINAPTNPVFSYGIIPLAVSLFAKESSMFGKPGQPEVLYDGTGTPVDTIAKRVNDMGKRAAWAAASVLTTGGMLLLQNALGLNVRPDVMSFEFEYWSDRYPNSYENVYRYLTPTPEWDSRSPTQPHNRWRWSMYTTKTMGDFFATVQIAHDHMKPFIPQLDKMETVDNLGRAGQWWWVVKTGYSF